MMKVLFGDKYYDAEDVNPEFGSDDDEDIKKPNFEKEDELLGGLLKDDLVCRDDGFLAARERSLKHKVADIDIDDNDDNDDDEGKKRKRKKKLSLMKRAKEALTEEYYKLDYEDTIGDLETRFKYAKTKPNRYGLKSGEILMVDDKELNQYVPLKKITPYREKEWKVPNNQRHQFKMKIREQLYHHHHSAKKRKQHREEAHTTTTDQQDDEGEHQIMVVVMSCPRKLIREDVAKQGPNYLTQGSLRMEKSHQNPKPKQSIESFPFLLLLLLLLLVHLG